jgi:hypothetical protein
MFLVWALLVCTLMTLGLSRGDRAVRPVMAAVFLGGFVVQAGAFTMLLVMAWCLCAMHLPDPPFAVALGTLPTAMIPILAAVHLHGHHGHAVITNAAFVAEETHDCQIV